MIHMDSTGLKCMYLEVPAGKISIDGLLCFGAGLCWFFPAGNLEPQNLPTYFVSFGQSQASQAFPVFPAFM